MLGANTFMPRVDGGIHRSAPFLQERVKVRARCQSKKMARLPRAQDAPPGAYAPRPRRHGRVISWRGEPVRCC